MADIADIFSDSDSDDSDDSELPFDVEIEKYEKRLQLARYRKKYRNTWGYVTNRWQNEHIHVVLNRLEREWRVYSAGSHEELQNISGAFAYLENISGHHLTGLEPNKAPLYFLDIVGGV